MRYLHNFEWPVILEELKKIAEDPVRADVASRLAVSRQPSKEGAPLRPWLYRVATNACLESMSVVWFPASSETFQ